jgi:hypothetical protein
LTYEELTGKQHRCRTGFIGGSSQQHNGECIIEDEERG